MDINLKALAKYVHYILGFSHGVEMNSRHSMLQKIPALHCTPLCSDTIDGILVVLYLLDFRGELDRDVK